MAASWMVCLQTLIILLTLSKSIILLALGSRKIKVIVLLWARQSFYRLWTSYVASWMAASDCKITLGETGYLGNPYFLLTGSLSIQFFDSPLPQSVRPPMVTYPSLCSISVICRTSCHAIGHQVLPTQHYLGKKRISLGVRGILTMCLHSYT